MFQALGCSAIPLLPHDTKRGGIPNIPYAVPSKLPFPMHQYIRHNPLHPKQTKKKGP